MYLIISQINLFFYLFYFFSVVFSCPSVQLSLCRLSIPEILQIPIRAPYAWSVNLFVYAIVSIHCFIFIVWYIIAFLHIYRTWVKVHVLHGVEYGVRAIKSSHLRLNNLQINEFPKLKFQVDEWNLAVIQFKTVAQNRAPSSMHAHVVELCLKMTCRSDCGYACQWVHIKSAKVKRTQTQKVIAIRGVQSTWSATRRDRNTCHRC